MPKEMNINVTENVIILQREQWQGNVAYISNYPGLLEEVKKYTWTYTAGEHPYLRCSAKQISLHKFVLQFLYGEECLNDMLGKSNIIEHLDNNGLNCAYENLHVLSEDMNKAKAFSIDKKSTEIKDNRYIDVPALITDVYYSHEKKFFQLQVFFNKELVLNKKTNKYVDSIILHYNDFDNLYIDWLYCFECIKTEKFDISKHHAVRIYVKDVLQITLTDEEKDAPFVKRDGEWYLVINPYKEKGPVAFVDHVSFREVDTNK